jgi:hypothetical protein
MLAARKSNVSVIEIARLYGVSRRTVYNAINEPAPARVRPEERRTNPDNKQEQIIDKWTEALDCARKAGDIVPLEILLKAAPTEVLRCIQERSRAARSSNLSTPYSKRHRPAGASIGP